MVGFSLLEQPSRSTTLVEELLRMEPPTYVFLATIADGKQLLRGEKGRTPAQTHPKSALGWVLIGRALARSLTQDHAGSLPVSSEVCVRAE